MYKEMAEIEITAICSGKGNKFLVESILKIEKEVKNPKTWRKHE